MAAKRTTKSNPTLMCNYFTDIVRLTNLCATKRKFSSNLTEKVKMILNNNTEKYWGDRLSPHSDLRSCGNKWRIKL